MSGTDNLSTRLEPGEPARPFADAAPPPVSPPVKRGFFRSWLIQDSPYIAMLVLALVGVTFHMSLDYWVVIAPIFAIICIVAGWQKFTTRNERLALILTQVLSWLAVSLAFFILASDGMQGLMNVPATSLAGLTQLALGTFVAGLQARVWRICAVGGVLFLAVPGIGWLKQSALLLFVATLIVIAIGALTWWVSNRRQQTA